MEDQTNWTPSSDDNKLNISDKDMINELEAKGIAAAELFVFDLDVETEISTQLILEVHKIAFYELYDWAGTWRTSHVNVGQLTPQEPSKVLQLMYQFTDNLNFKVKNARSKNSRLIVWYLPTMSLLKSIPSIMKMAEQAELL